MIEVTLTPAEILLAAQVGVHRQVYNLKHEVADVAGAPSWSAWQSALSRESR